MSNMDILMKKTTTSKFWDFQRTVSLSPAPPRTSSNPNAHTRKRHPSSNVNVNNKDTRHRSPRHLNSFSSVSPSKLQFASSPLAPFRYVLNLTYLFYNSNLLHLRPLLSPLLSHRPRIPQINRYGPTPTSASTAFATLSLQQSHAMRRGLRSRGSAPNLPRSARTAPRKTSLNSTRALLLPTLLATTETREPPHLPPLLPLPRLCWAYRGLLLYPPLSPTPASRKVTQSQS